MATSTRAFLLVISSALLAAELCNGELKIGGGARPCKDEQA